MCIDGETPGIDKEMGNMAGDSVGRTVMYGSKYFLHRTNVPPTDRFL